MRYARLTSKSYDCPPSLLGTSFPQGPLNRLEFSPYHSCVQECVSVWAVSGGPEIHASAPAPKRSITLLLAWNYLLMTPIFGHRRLLLGFCACAPLLPKPAAGTHLFEGGLGVGVLGLRMKLGEVMPGLGQVHVVALPGGGREEGGGGTRSVGEGSQKIDLRVPRVFFQVIAP